jgi:hypothetical protein
VSSRALPSFSTGAVSIFTMMSPRAGLGRPNGFGVGTCPVLPGAWLLLFALLAPAIGAPFVPTRDDLVLEAVRSPGMVAAAKENGFPITQCSTT